MYDETRQDPTPRIPLKAPVTVVTGNNGGPPQTLQMRNLGPGGLFLDCDRPLPEGEQVRVSFALPGGQQINTPARVIRAVHGGVHDPTGMALRFEGLEPSAAESLDLLMDGVEHLGDGPHLEPEEELTDPVLSQEFVNFSLSLRTRDEL